jgi:drug/metabolite transporter (DMT)-like permease
VFGSIDKEFRIRLLSLGFMSVLLTLLSIIIIYFLTDFYFNIIYEIGIFLIFMLAFYISIVHNHRHENTIKKINKINIIWRVIGTVIVYGITIFAYIMYLKVPIN